MSRSSRSVLTILAGLVGILFLAIYMFKQSDFTFLQDRMPGVIGEETASSTFPVAETLSNIAIRAPKGMIKALVASTSAEQELGLGRRISLPDGEGMLFPFQYPGDYGFWMKDMLFPIDIVWILSNKRVAAVTRDVSPDTYPETFYPPLAISYVLELSSGAAEKFGIATDTQLEF